jgi:hypothetical protein
VGKLPVDRRDARAGRVPSSLGRDEEVRLCDVAVEQRGRRLVEELPVLADAVDDGVVVFREPL